MSGRDAPEPDNQRLEDRSDVEDRSDAEDRSDVPFVSKSGRVAIETND